MSSEVPGKFIGVKVGPSISKSPVSFIVCSKILWSKPKCELCQGRRSSADIPATPWIGLSDGGFPTTARSIFEKLPSKSWGLLWCLNNPLIAAATYSSFGTSTSVWVLGLDTLWIRRNASFCCATARCSRRLKQNIFENSVLVTSSKSDITRTLLPNISVFFWLHQRILLRVRTSLYEYLDTF